MNINSLPIYLLSSGNYMIQKNHFCVNVLKSQLETSSDRSEPRISFGIQSIENELTNHATENDDQSYNLNYNRNW